MSRNAEAACIDRNPITAEEAREWFAYDPETGVIAWRKRRSNALAGRVAGSQDGFGYWRVGFQYKNYRHNRLAWLIVTGDWPAGEVDHINGVTSDNRWSNLRSVTRAVNGQNLRRAHRDSKTGFLGVTFDKRSGTFGASIVVAKRHRGLGRFETAEAAHQAYVAAKRRHHEGGTL